MVEGQKLFEWSSEVCLAMGTRFCSWVVAETEAENILDESEEKKSEGEYEDNENRDSRQDSMKPHGSESLSRAASFLSQSLITPKEPAAATTEEEHIPTFRFRSLSN